MRALMSWVARYAGLVRVGLWLASAAAAFLAWRWLPEKALAVVSLTLMQTSMVAAMSVWALREKAEDELLGTAEDAQSVERTGHVVRQVLQPRFVQRAAFTVLMVGLVSIPAFTDFLANAVWHWSVYAASFGIVECLYSFLLANLWNAQIREFKASKALADLRRRERAAQIRALGPIEESGVAVSDWGSPVQAAVSK